MIIHNIKQQTEEWFKIKYGKIGGTRAGNLFVKSDTLLIELLAELTEPFVMNDDEYLSADMLRGYELEPVARRELIKYTGILFNQAGWIECEEQPLFGISPDGISDYGVHSCEIKCPSAKRHISTVLSGEIPLDNIDQCIHYFTVNPLLQQHFFCSFRPESVKPLFVKMLTRDSKINAGTRAKPIVKTVQEVVNESHNLTVTLQGQIKDALASISF